MSKFNVGDRVRFVAGGHSSYQGKLGTVRSEEYMGPCGGPYILVKFDDAEREPVKGEGWCPTQFELVAGVKYLSVAEPEESGDIDAYIIIDDDGDAQAWASNQQDALEEAVVASKRSGLVRVYKRIATIEVEV